MAASQKQITRKRTAQSDAPSKVFPKMRFLTLDTAVLRQTAVTEIGSRLFPLKSREHPRKNSDRCRTGRTPQAEQTSVESRSPHAAAAVHLPCR